MFYRKNIIYFIHISQLTMLLAVLDQAVRTNPENTRLASLWHNLLKNNVDLKESNRGRVDQNEGR